MTGPSRETEDWLVRFTDWTPDDDWREYLCPELAAALRRVRQDTTTPEENPNG